MWLIVLTLILLLALSYVWFAKPWWCLWHLLQWQTRKRYQLWMQDVDSLPGNALFIAICPEPTVLMAIILKSVTRLPIMCVTDEPKGSLSLHRLLRRNRIITVGSLDDVDDISRHVLLMSVSTYQQYRDTLSYAVMLLHLCGADRDSKPTKSVKLRRLQFSIKPVDAISTDDVIQQWHYFDVQCWQQYIPRLPSIMEMWLSQAKVGKNRLSIVDSMGAAVTHQKLLVAVKTMRDHLYDTLKHQPRIGICLPPSVVGNIAMLVTLSLGKTMVNLNYTASIEALQNAVKESELTTLITSRKFIHNLKNKGFDINDAFNKLDIVYLEDVKKALRKIDLLKNVFITRFASIKYLKRIMATPVSMHNTVAILFSSGSGGIPKGIELTHENLIGNVKQAANALNTTSDDVIMAILPIFHAFGLTITSLLPLMEGAVAVCHADPRDAVVIGTMVQRYKATVMCGTSTFLRLYARNRGVLPEMFDSLRYVVAGAEKLQPAVRILFEEKFKKVVYEGYGTTELSPVTSVNQPDTLNEIRHEKGTIGRPLAGCMFRIVDPDTHEALPVGVAGMITVGGVNVMKGYLNNPHKTNNVILRHCDIRWYITGDKGRLDQRGFVTILDRYSRFAKLGGEMISLGAVEKQINDVISNSDVEVLAVGVPDSKKGEVVTLLIAGQIAVSHVKTMVIKSDMHNLMKPQWYFRVESIPKLATGKNDFSAAKQLAAELVSAK